MRRFTFLVALTVILALGASRSLRAQGNVQIYIPSGNGLRIAFPSAMAGPVELAGSGGSFTVTIPSGTQGPLEIGGSGDQPLVVSFPGGSVVDVFGAVGTVELPGSAAVDLSQNNVVVTFPKRGSITIPVRRRPGVNTRITVRGTAANIRRGIRIPRPTPGSLPSWQSLCQCPHDTDEGPKRLAQALPGREILG